MLLRLAAAVACAAVWILPGAAEALDRIPFTTSSTGSMQVQARIYDAPATMLVDLGAGLDIVSGMVAARVVQVYGKYATLRLTGQRVDLPIGTLLGPITVGPFAVSERVVGVWQGLNGSGVDGLLSATAFRNVAVTFDFRSHELVMEDAPSFAARKLFAARVPLVLQDDLGIALGVLARFDFGNGKSGLCVVDTGISGIVLDRTFAKSLGIDLNDAALKHERTPLGDGVATTIPELTLVGAPQTKMTEPSVVFADLVNDCNVGTSFWAGKMFTLDLPERAMFVPPPA